MKKVKYRRFNEDHMIFYQLSNGGRVTIMSSILKKVMCKFDVKNLGKMKFFLELKPPALQTELCYLSTYIS